MFHNRLPAFLACLLVALSLSAASAAQEPHEGSSYPITAIRMGVTDLDASTSFYTKHLGCTVAGDHRDHGYMMLENQGVYLVLTKAEQTLSIGESMCHTRINFAVRDLDASVAALKAGGVRFIGEKKSAVGRYAAFLDPSGNLHNLKQLDQPQDQPSDSPRIYDIAISVTDMKQATDFYVGKLGYQEQGRKYYPPVVPMKQNGSAFFILSEDAKHRAPYRYGKKAMTGLAFYAEDLASAMASLRERGVTFIHEQPQKAGNVTYAAFADPFGNVHELVSHDDAPPLEPDAAAAQTSGIDTAKASAPASIEDLAWIAGTWKSSSAPGELCEVWSAPQGNSMMGMFKWSRQGKASMYEFMTIQQDGEEINFRLRHFDPKLTPWEKEGPLIYPLVRTGERVAIFENPSVSADHPRRFVYRREGDSLTIRLEPADPQQAADEFKLDLDRDE